MVRALDPDAPNGRGPRLVDGLASDRGVYVGATGKTVWFSLLSDDSSVSGGFPRVV